MAIIRGTNGNNLLIGTNLGDYIEGLGGNDTLRGNGGNDTILGGGGNDTAFGGDGNDTIRDFAGFIHDFHGGNGNDELTLRLTISYSAEEQNWKTSLSGEGLSLWLRHCPHLVAWGRFQAATDKMLIAPEATE